MSVKLFGSIASFVFKNSYIASLFQLNRNLVIYS